MTNYLKYGYIKHCMNLHVQWACSFSSNVRCGIVPSSYLRRMWQNCYEVRSCNLSYRRQNDVNSLWRNKDVGHYDWPWGVMTDDKGPFIIYGRGRRFWRGHFLASRRWGAAYIWQVPNGGHFYGSADFLKARETQFLRVLGKNKTKKTSVGGTYF